MLYSPGSTYYQQFTTFNASGISTNTDSTPWGTLVRNGLDDAAQKVFITNVDVGRYTASGIIPSTYTNGNSINLVVSGQVNASLSKSIISLGVLDGYLYNLTTISVTGTVSSVLSPSGFEQIFFEPGMNARQSFTHMAAALAGTSSGVNNTVWYQGINNPNQNRISAVAISGTRSTIILTNP